MKTNKTKAKSPENTERNRSKKVARRAAHRRERHQNSTMLGCMIRQPISVLDLISPGVHTGTPTTYGERELRFHGAVAAAFEFADRM